MQDRYVGDVGDFAKYSLINALSDGFSLGVAWYLFPDESHNLDGKHVSYLNDPESWRTKDTSVFDGLNKLVSEKKRNTSSVILKKIIEPDFVHNNALNFSSLNYSERVEWRKSWFESALESLSKADIVFADPDNGLCETTKFKYGNKKNWKRLPLNEAHDLSKKRTAIIYHHNSRFKGGHVEEIKYWLNQFVSNSFAVRYRAYSSRTFFVINCKDFHVQRAQIWSHRFRPKAEIIQL